MFKIFLAEENAIIEHLDSSLNVVAMAKKTFNLDKEDVDRFNLESVSCFPAKTAENSDGLGGSGILSVVGNEAKIFIRGILSSTPSSFMDKLFGIQVLSYGEILTALDLVESNSDVEKLKLIIDSPGGEVKGQDKVFQKIFSLREKMEIVAESHGQIASGAYWIASAAHKIIASSPADEIGSIGIVVLAIDSSKFEDEIGIKRVEVVSKNAKDKRPDVSTKKGIGVLQDRVDALEAVFIERLAQGRDLSPEFIIENFGNGRMLVAEHPDKKGKDALSAKMIDGVMGSLALGEDDDSVGSSGVESNKSGDVVAVGKNLINTKNDKCLNIKEEDMDCQDLMGDASENRPLKSEVEAALKAAKEEGRQEFIKANERVMAVLSGKGDYPEAIKNLGLEVLAGKQDVVAFVSAVTVVDSMREKENSDAAKKENPNPTAGESHDEGVNSECIVNSQEDVKKTE